MRPPGERRGQFLSASKPPRSEASVRGPATKAELLQRLDARAKPSVERKLTPNGAVTMRVNKDNDRSNEARIVALQTRLQSASARLRDGYGKAVYGGGNSRDFEESR